MQPDGHLVRHDLERYRDGDLSIPELERARAHFGDCASCRREAEAYDAFLLALDRLPVPEPPPGFDVRILDTLFPRPNENVLLLRLATRAYAVLAVILTAVAVGVLGMEGPGPVAGTAASGFSRILADALESVRTLAVGFVDVIKAMTELTPLARVAGSLTRGLETAAVALAPQYLMVLGLLMVLATLVLIWAMSPARERGVPHVSLL